MRRDLDKPCRIMVAPNGARRGKKDHPALPITPIEMAETARLCADAGATAIHLHARDGRGNHTLARHIYDSYLVAVKRAVGDRMTIQITTESVGKYTAEQQIDAVRKIRPEAVSLVLREILPKAGDERQAGDFFAWLARHDIETQYICFEPEELAHYLRLKERGVVPDGHRDVLFVLGRYLRDGETVEPRVLNEFLALGGDATNWMVCAFGKEETACLTAALCLGGHVRVGFENSLWLGDGRQAPDNAAKVAEIRTIAERIGRKLEG